MTIQEIEQKLNDLNVEFGGRLDELNQALAELKESKKEGKWLPNYGDTYWLRDTWGNFRTHEFFPGDDMKWRLNNIPLFPTKEECERYWHFMDTVKEKSYEFTADEWEDDDIVKWRINYYFNDKDFQIDEHYTYYAIGGIYFKTYEDAQYIIDNFKDELMEYFV